MSDILIRGVEMPKHCGECKLTAEYDDETFCPFFTENVEYWIAVGRRHEECPLGPVQQHGRLIDADALIEDLKYDVELDAVALDSMEIVGDERRKIQDDKDLKQNCIFWIEDAPTIIPASE